MENYRAFDINDSSTTVAVSITSGAMEQQTGSEASSSVDYWNIVGICRGVLIAVVVVLGLAFNSFLVVAILSNRKLRGKVVNVLNCHLAAVGILWCAILVLFEAFAGVLGSWVDLCGAYAISRTLVCHVTVWTIGAISWDKYRTIASPMRHSPTAELLPVSACLGIIWIAGFITVAFPYLFCGFDLTQTGAIRRTMLEEMQNDTGSNALRCSGYLFDPRMSVCRASMDETVLAWYSVVLTVETFCLPLALLGYCYCHIFRIARWQKKRIAVMTAMVRVITLSVGVPITHENARHTSNQVTLRGRKALRTVCIFLGAFLVCYAPYGFTSLAVSLYHIRLDSLPVTIADFLLMTSPAVNAFVYGVRNRMLKQSLQNCVRKKCAQYALKFPSLQDTILRRFVSPDQVLEPIRIFYETKCHKIAYDVDAEAAKEETDLESSGKDMVCADSNFSLHPSENSSSVRNSEAMVLCFLSENHRQNSSKRSVEDLAKVEVCASRTSTLRKGKLNGQLNSNSIALPVTASKKVSLRRQSSLEGINRSSSLGTVGKAETPTVLVNDHGRSHVMVGADVHGVNPDVTSDL